MAEDKKKGEIAVIEINEEFKVNYICLFDYLFISS